MRTNIDASNMFGHRPLMINIALSLMMLAGFALIVGAIIMVRRDGWTRKPLLMLVLAGIMFANVAIWAVPNERGVAPAEAVAE
ncbi:MAG: hypothetical protein AAGH53_03830 [Pseudomonadota bacterium]